MLKEDGPKLHPAAGKVSKYVIICPFILNNKHFKYCYYLYYTLTFTGFVRCR